MSDVRLSCLISPLTFSHRRASLGFTWTCDAGFISESGQNVSNPFETVHGFPWRMSATWMSRADTSTRTPYPAMSDLASFVVTP